jgi:hypothetical protein
MKKTWTLVYALEKEELPTFKAAAERMLKRVNKEIGKGQLSWQILETAVWIEPIGGDMPPIMFYTVRDIASECGWINEWLPKKQRAGLSSPPVNESKTSCSSYTYEN